MEKVTDELTPLERNALKWVQLCERFGLDSATTDIFDFTVNGVDDPWQ